MVLQLAPFGGSSAGGKTQASKNIEDAEDGKERKKVSKVQQKAARKRLAFYTKQEAGPLTVGILALLINSVTNISFPRIMGKIIDKTGNSKGPILQNTEFRVFLMSAFGIFSCGALASYIRTSCFINTKQRIIKRLRADLFKSLMLQEKAFFDQHPSAELSSVLNQDVLEAAETTTNKLGNGIRGIASLLNGTGMLLFISPKLTGLAVSVIPMIGGSAMIFHKWIKKIGKIQEEQANSLLSFSTERVSNEKTVKLFSQEYVEIDKFSDMLENYTALTRKEASARGFLMGGLNIGLNCTLISVLTYGGSLISRGELTTGELTSFALYSSMVGLGAASIAAFLADLAKGLQSAARIFEIIDRIPQMKDEGLELPSVTGEIRFERVSFSYPTREGAPLFRDLNINIPAGTNIALVGASGSGKSTIASLLSRLYDPDEGVITIDGVPLSTMKPSWLRRQIGVVDQEPILFAGSIASNIAYGVPEATPDQIVRAAKEANADDFISSFPNGYDTEVGEQGRQLSGGEKQRIAIARAILKDPPILILDEATSSLDGESEKLVNDALQQLMEKRTTIVIAHRRSTIRSAKTLLYLNAGKIEDQGCYSDLLEKSSNFAKLMSDIDEKL